MLLIAISNENIEVSVASTLQTVPAVVLSLDSIDQQRFDSDSQVDTAPLNKPVVSLSFC